MLENSRKVVGVVSDLMSKKSGTGTSDNKPKAKWNSIAQEIKRQLHTSGHPVFRCSYVLEEGQLKLQTWKRDQAPSMPIRVLPSY